jgi:heme exporter protein D
MSFFEMGGYAAYVWPAFGVGAVVLIALLGISLRSLKRRDAELRRLEAASGGGGRGRGGAANDASNDTAKEEAPS